MSEAPELYVFLNQHQRNEFRDEFERWGEHVELEEGQSFDDWIFSLNLHDYKKVEEGREADMHGYYDSADVMDYIVVKRLSDETYWKMQDHYESWGDDSTSLGSYGSIFQVYPVSKVVYERR